MLLKDNNNFKPSRDRSGSRKWREIGAESLETWNLKLEATSCPYRQFPFWVESYRLLGYTPRYFAFGEDDDPTAFVAILEVGIYPLRFGLIDRGPFIFDPESNDVDKCLASLVELVTKQGYVFVRFTQGQEMVFTQIRDMESIHQAEPYPFCRDSRNSLIVEQKISDDEMLAGFDSKARYGIRKAARVGYELRASTAEQDFDIAWDLFKKLSVRKGFQLSAKPKKVWRKVLNLAGERGFARVYLCYFDGKLVAARLNIRDGVTDEQMLSALDVEMLNGMPSPAPLLTWFAMRDGHRLGCKFYNMGGPGDPGRNNHVFGFKKKFNPSSQVAPGPLCLVLRPLTYWFWTHVLLRAWRSWRDRFGNRSQIGRDNQRGIADEKNLAAI